MSFNWNLSDDEGDDGLEDLWRSSTAHQKDDNSDAVSNDNEDYDDDALPFSLAMRQSHDVSASASMPSDFDLKSDDYDDQDDDDEDDEINWEDADDDVDPNNENSDNIIANEQGDYLAVNIKVTANTAATAKGPSKAVTIDLDSKPPAKSSEKKKKALKKRNRYSYQSLPRNIQVLLNNLHRSHWLALTSSLVFTSSLCSDDSLLALAYSLIPAAWSESSKQVPALADLKVFCEWFFDLIHNAESRRNNARQANLAAGAPRLRRKRGSRSKQDRKTISSGTRFPTKRRLVDYCAYLSMSLAEDPQLFQQEDNVTPDWSSLDKASLFIAMARSLGWRARCVLAVEPIRIDLDVDHPMLRNAMTNVFQAVANWTKTAEGEQKTTTPRKRKYARLKGSGSRTPELMTFDESPTFQLNDDSNMMFGWVEVLCEGTRQRRQPQQQPTMKWIHVDPHLQAVNEPQRVESYLYEQRQVADMVMEAFPNKKRRASLSGLGKKRHPVAYVMAAEHSTDLAKKRVTDVTPRYAASMVESLRLRGIPPKAQAKVVAAPKSTWWFQSVRTLNYALKGNVEKNSAFGPAKNSSPCSQKSGNTHDKAIAIFTDDEQKPAETIDHDDGEDPADSFERTELAASAQSEALPTSKEKFKNHPVYVIRSVLKSTEVLAPDAKLCSLFKGQPVYLRKDVSEALTEKKWLYKGRRVKESELSKPAKRVKSRAKSSTGGGSGFKALSSYGVGKDNDGGEESKRKQLELASKPLSDGMQDLFAIWQTDPWKPPYVGPPDEIPVNEYNNVELELLNPGLAHLDEPGVAKVAKKLGIPYAPCLLGFEGHRGNATPTIRGIVVHQHNAELLREASAEVASKNIEDEAERLRKEIYSKWKRLLVGVLTKDRLEREYG